LDDLPVAFPSDTTPTLAHPLNSVDLADDDPYISTLHPDALHIQAVYLSTDYTRRKAKQLADAPIQLRRYERMLTQVLHQAHFDGRSMASTTNFLQALWYYRLINTNMFLLVLVFFAYQALNPLAIQCYSVCTRLPSTPPSFPLSLLECSFALAVTPASPILILKTA
jgi:hypothetical protein